METLGKGIKILGALLPNGADAAWCFLCQRLSAAAGGIRQVALVGKRLKVSFLHLDLRSNHPPIPFCWQIQTRKNPDFKFFPSVFGQEQERLPIAELLLKAVETLAPIRVAIAVYAQDENIRHARVSSDDLCDAFRLQCFPDAAKKRVKTDTHTRGPFANGLKEP